MGACACTSSIGICASPPHQHTALSIAKPKEMSEISEHSAKLCEVETPAPDRLTECLPLKLVSRIWRGFEREKRVEEGFARVPGAVKTPNRCVEVLHPAQKSSGRCLPNASDHRTCQWWSMRYPLEDERKSLCRAALQRQNPSS